MGTVDEGCDVCLVSDRIVYTSRRPYFGVECLVPSKWDLWSYYIRHRISHALNKYITLNIRHALLCSCRHFCDQTYLYVCAKTIRNHTGYSFDYFVSVDWSVSNPQWRLHNVWQLKVVKLQWGCLVLM